MTLEKFIKAIDKTACEIFAHVGRLQPIYHIVAENGDVMILPALSPDKDVSVAMAQAAMVLFDATRYVFLCEAWVLQTEDQEEMNRVWKSGEGIADHPNRIEMIHYQGEDDKEGSLTASRLIVRTEGQSPHLSKLVFRRDGTSEGRFVGLLPGRERPQ